MTEEARHNAYAGERQEHVGAESVASFLERIGTRSILALEERSLPDRRISK